jgi:hypothetical protein
MCEAGERHGVETVDYGMVVRDDQLAQVWKDFRIYNVSVNWIVGPYGNSLDF